jgi:hypothetical protein
MVKYIKITFINFLFVFISCKDAVLVIPKENNYSQKLNLSGYYYLKSSKPYENTNDIYFLYENGVILYGGSPSSNNESYINDLLNNVLLKNNSIYNYKYRWGRYIIKDNDLEFERWIPSSGGPLKTVIFKGQILNNNSFVIKSTYSNYSKSGNKLENLYEFRPFSPKPDSTNKFVN